MNSAKDIWDRVLEMLKADLTSTAIDTWFNDCTAIDVSDNKLVLSTPTSFKKGIIETRYAPIIKSILFEIFSGDFDVVVLTDNEAERYSKPKTESDDSIYDVFTFEHFVVGKSNNMAHAAAKAVAEGNTRQYNPLFIYGNSGLGKTHLLHAIRLRVRERHPEYNIVYVRVMTL